MLINRRNFLKGLGATVALSTLPGAQSFAYNPLHLKNPNDEIFVFVFLKGGCDALNFIAPMGNRHYADARLTELQVPEHAKFTLKNGLDGLDFNIHPKASALKELYDSGDMAIVQALGLSNGTRSHFEATKLIEQGLAKNKSSAQGWMTRYFETISATGTLPAVSIGNNGLAASFNGCTQAVSIDRISDFKVKGKPVLQDILANFYQGESNLHLAGQKALSTIKVLQSKNVNDTPYHPEHGANYPSEWSIKSFSESLQNLAQLIKMDTGVHIATVEYDGWDHHENQAHHFPKRLEGLSDALAAFYNDMTKYHNRMTMVVMSEFGRRLKSNRSGGTDHGHGGLALVLGGQVKGGKMYGKWPGLATHELNNNVDLDVTTDYRTVLSEVLQKQFSNQHLDTIFPDFKAPKMLGFL
ncbi:MAG: DUF1501 domain-containing protein [Aureispira sp.]|nr:DUF1501 domain-containing protein [Aureispira sp.]